MDKKIKIILISLAAVCSLVVLAYFAYVHFFGANFFAIDKCLDGGGCWDEIDNTCRKDEPNAQELCDRSKNRVWGYEEYIPLVSNGDEITESRVLLTDEHRANVIKVLEYYDEKWKIENGTLFVSRTIDDDTLWNYTTKANDSAWLAGHR